MKLWPLTNSGARIAVDKLKEIKREIVSHFMVILNKALKHFFSFEVFDFAMLTLKLNGNIFKCNFETQNCKFTK